MSNYMKNKEKNIENNIEADVKRALDNASMEYISNLMEDINPSDFKMPDEVSAKRIKKNVMKRINSNNNNQNRLGMMVMKYSLGIVATLILICGLSMIFSQTVRATLLGMFTFVPGKGVVENTEETVNGDVVYSDIYLLSNAGIMAENEDISIKTASASVKDNTLDIEYLSELKNIDSEQLSKVYEQVYEVNEMGGSMDSFKDEFASMGYTLPDGVTNDTLYMEALAAFYSQNGYDKYFNIIPDNTDTYDAIKTPKATITIDGKTYTATSAKVVFNEASGGKYANIKESYSIDCDISSIKECTLNLDELSIPLEFCIADSYENMSDVLGAYGSGTIGDITIICEGQREEDTYYITVYPVDYGSYEEMFSPRVSLKVNDNYIEGYPAQYYPNIFDDLDSDSDQSMTFHYEFDVSGYPEDASYTACISEVTVSSAIPEPKKIALNISEMDYGINNINKTYNTKIGDITITSVEIINGNDDGYDGDSVKIYYESNSEYNLNGFSYSYFGDGEEVPLTYNVFEPGTPQIVVLGKNKNEVEYIVIDYPCFDISDSVEIPLN